MTDRTAPASPDGAKVEMRSAMSAMRRALPDRESRSEAIWQHLMELPALVVAEHVLAFTTLPGEPETRSLFVWGAATGRLVDVPESDVSPTWPDVVVVPGLAFTVGGQRLGRGGGWYDRFLPGVRADCTTVGVCFVEQVVGALPVESHDVAVDHVVTDQSVLR